MVLGGTFMSTLTVSSLSWSALKRKDLRRHRRYTVTNSVLRVSWLDIGSHLKMALVRVLNVSEGGMALELPEQPLPQSQIRFQSERHKVVGSAKVRHSRRNGTKWIVGVEFTEGIRWAPPEGEVEEPITLFGPDYYH